MRSFTALALLALADVFAELPFTAAGLAAEDDDGEHEEHVSDEGHYGEEDTAGEDDEADVLGHDEEVEEGEDAELFDGLDGEEAEGDEEGHAAQEAVSAEQLAKLHELFDKDGDGKVSKQEIMDFSKSVAGAMALRLAHFYLESFGLHSDDGKITLEMHLQSLREVHNETSPEKYRLSEELESNKFHISDKDKDGFLDDEELAGLIEPGAEPAVLDVVIADTYKRFDTDKDGKLQATEFAALDPENDLTAEFAELDKDHSLALEDPEIRHFESGTYLIERAMDKLIKVADKDGDGYISAEEITDAVEDIIDSEAHDHLLEWAEHSEL